MNFGVKILLKSNKNGKKNSKLYPPPMFGNNFFDIFNRMLGKKQNFGGFLSSAITN